MAGTGRVSGVTTRAVVYRGPRNLVVEDIPDRRSGPGSVRVAVESAGLCGTDVRIVKGEHSAYTGVTDRIPGHEIVGRIAHSEDPLPNGLRQGDRVFVAPNIGCGHCRSCLTGNENLCAATDGIGITIDGGFAEYVDVPARAVARGNLIALDDSVNPDAAVLIEPLACVLRGQDKVNVHRGDTVLVLGAGPIGLLHIALAKARGAGLVIASARSELRRDAARRAGADLVVDSDESKLVDYATDATGGAGVDVVITAAPVHLHQVLALQMAAAAGRVLLFAGLPRSNPRVELDTNLIHYKELSVTGTTASTLSDCTAAAALVLNGDLDVDWMVSDVVALTDFSRGVGMVERSTARKVVVKPQAEWNPS